MDIDNTHISAKRALGFLISPILAAAIALLFELFHFPPLAIGTGGFAVVLLLLLAAELLTLASVLRRGFYLTEALPELWISYVLYNHCVVPAPFAAQKTALLTAALAVKAILLCAGLVQRSRQRLDTADFFSRYMLVLLFAELLTLSSRIFNISILGYR